MKITSHKRKAGDKAETNTKCKRQAPILLFNTSLYKQLYRQSLL